MSRSSGKTQRDESVTAMFGGVTISPLASRRKAAARRGPGGGRGAGRQGQAGHRQEAGEGYAVRGRAHSYYVTHVVHLPLRDSCGPAATVVQLHGQLPLLREGRPSMRCCGRAGSRCAVTAIDSCRSSAARTRGVGLAPVCSSSSLPSSSGCLRVERGGRCVALPSAWLWASG